MFWVKIKKNGIPLSIAQVPETRPRYIYSHSTLVSAVSDIVSSIFNLIGCSVIP